MFYYAQGKNEFIHDDCLRMLPSEYVLITHESTTNNPHAYC